MGKARYPTPEEARRHFETGVEQAKEKYVERAKQGAEDFEDWFTVFAAEVYPTIATLPSREGLATIKERIEKRSVPVAEKISRTAAAYRKAKLEEVRKEVEAAAKELVKVIV